MLLVETRAQSDADDLMRRRTKAEPHSRSSDGSILRLIEWDYEAVELLSGTCSQDAQARRDVARHVAAPRDLRAASQSGLGSHRADPRRERG